MTRPRQFDEELLLERAQDRFWVGGYDRTSIDDISRVSGVGNGSIYAAYGSKLALFLEVFRRYCAQRVALVESVIDAHDGDFESAVANYLEQIILDCGSHPDHRGCLMLNSLSDLALRFPEVVEVGRESMTAMEGIVTARVLRAVEAGELDLDPQEAEALGAHIVLVSQGLIQMDRIGVDGDHLREIAATSTRLSSLLRHA
jgi:AcrR family transcriptional regulator